MKSIEEIVREQLGGAEQRPPAGTWDEIASRMSSPTTAAKHGIRGSIAVAAIVAVVAMAAAVVYLATRPSEIPAATPETAATITESGEQITENGELRTESSEPKTESKERTAVNEERKTDAVYAESAAPVIVPVSNPIAALQESEVGGTEQMEIIAETEPREPESKPKAAATDSVPATKVLPPAEDDERPATQNEMAKIVIPNLLTPNGDGHNDCWVIPNLEQYGTVMVQIYTARSQMVYSSGNYRNDFCGGSLEDGNYFYVINFRERSFVRRGVLVIRRQ